MLLDVGWHPRDEENSGGSIATFTAAMILGAIMSPFLGDWWWSLICAVLALVGVWLIVSSDYMRGRR